MGTRSVGKRNKERGYELEAEVVHAAKARGLQAQRAWGSNGRALGLPQEVDVVINTGVGDVWIQCKRKKRVAEYLVPSGEAHIQVVRADRQQALAVIPLDLLLSLFPKTHEHSHDPT